MKRFPLNKRRIFVTSDSDSFKDVDFSVATEIPVKGHCGAFGSQRRYDTHTGVDLYCPEGEEVFAIEDGTIVRIEHFTGKAANSDWWNDTMAVHVEGESGVIVYGEITPESNIIEGMSIESGQKLGKVKQVLKKDKGRPMCMLHVELYKHGSRQTCIWQPDKPKNDNLLNPTDLLISLIPRDTKSMLIQAIEDSMDHKGLDIELSRNFKKDFFGVDEEIKEGNIRTYTRGNYINSHMFLYTFYKMLAHNEVEVIFKDTANPKNIEYLEKLSKGMVNPNGEV